MHIMSAEAAYTLLVVSGVAYLAIAYITTRIKVHDTHSFVIGDRQIGMGLGVGALISAWTYAVAIMMSSGAAYKWGLSGLWWFAWPNGVAVLLIIPVGRRLRNLLPNGYTLPEFARLRFDNKNHVLYWVSMIYLMIVTMMINMKGLSVAFSALFDVNWINVVIVATIIVGIYSIFGGIWTSATTGTVQTIIIAVVPIIVTFAVLNNVGVTFVFEKLSAAPARYTDVLDYTGLIDFGLLFALGVWTQILTDQMFWQKVWSFKRKYMEKIFLFGGIFFYPIPIALGTLGLVGLVLGANLSQDLGGDIAAVGPWVIGTLAPEIGSWLIILYAVMVMADAFSTMDSAFTAVSSIAAVDIVKVYRPDIHGRRLFIITKLSIVVAAVFALLILLSGLPMTKLWLIVFGVGSARCLPFLFALFWRKTNPNAAFWAVIIGGLVSLPLFFSQGIFGLPADAAGFFAAIGVSFLVVLIWSLISPQNYDFSKLKDLGEVLLEGGDARASQPRSATLAKGN